MRTAVTCDRKSKSGIELTQDKQERMFPRAGGKKERLPTRRLKTTETYFLTCFGGLNSKGKVLAELFPWEAPSLSYLLRTAAARLGVSWVVDPSGHSLPPPSPGVLPCFSLFLSYEDQSY